MPTFKGLSLLRQTSPDFCCFIVFEQQHRLNEKLCQINLAARSARTWTQGIAALGLEFVDLSGDGLLCSDTH